MSKYLTEYDAINQYSDQDYIDFAGQTCEGDCAGWDMQSRRCECGNRRVGWVTEQYDDGSWAAHAEAW